MVGNRRRWDDVEKYIGEDSVLEFQETLRKAMLENNLTHADLANMFGVSRSRVSQLFHADVNPSLRYVGLLLFKLGYTITFRKDGDNIPKNSSLSVRSSLLPCEIVEPRLDII